MVKNLICLFFVCTQSRPSTVQPSGSPQHNIPAPVVPQQYLATSQAVSYLDNRDVNNKSSSSSAESSPSKSHRDNVGEAAILDHRASATGAGNSNDLSPTDERRSSLHRRGNDNSSHNNGNVTNSSSGSSITSSGANNGTKRTNSPALNHIIYPLLSEVSRQLRSQL